MEQLDELLQQSGVKGMHWGVRRNNDRPGGADGKFDPAHSPARSALGWKLNSLKRERQWKSVLKEMHDLSTEDLLTISKRVSLENSLKTLSKSKVGTKSDRDDYHRREHMDNDELSKKVVRLKAKESLHNAVHSASKEQREFGQKIVQVGGSLGVKYALTRTIGPKDVFDAIKNPKSSADKAKSDLLKVALEKVKAKHAKP